jgi:hypothetical protein
MNELLVHNLNSLNNSKYIYRINKCDTEFIIFDILLNQTNKISNRLKIIKKSRYGKVISYSNEIKYNMINKININCINVNNLKKIINVDCLINQSKNKTIFMNDLIKIKIYNKNNFLIIEYKLIDI